MRSELRPAIRLHHVALQTAHFDRAFALYTEVLGLPVLKKPFTFKGKRTLAWLQAGTITIELYSVKDGKTPQPYDDRRVGADHIAFEVPNLDAILERLRQHNIRVLKEPFLPPTGDPQQPRVAFIEGVDGEEIELREPPSEGPEDLRET